MPVRATWRISPTTPSRRIARGVKPISCISTYPTTNATRTSPALARYGIERSSWPRSPPQTVPMIMATLETIEARANTRSSSCR